jgi:hypothetical protein
MKSSLTHKRIKISFKIYRGNVRKILFNPLNNNLNRANGEQEIENENTSFGNIAITCPFNPNEIEIETPPYAVRYLIDRMERNEIDISPDFQREDNL